MTTISDKFNRAFQSKEAIRQALISKGVEVSTDVPFADYAEKINNIESGSDNNPYQELYMQRTANETSMKGLFAYTPASTTLDLSMMNTSKVTDMSYMFSYCRVPYLDLSGLDVSNVSKAEYMFNQCTSEINIDGWDTSKLTNATGLFYYFTNNNKYLDLSVLDFSNVTKADGMFEYCNLDNIDIRNINLNLAKLSNLPFENVSGTVLDLSNYDITGLKSTYQLCYYCGCSTINLTNWKTTEVTDMRNTFYHCLSTEKIIMPDWDMTNTTNTSSFFYNCDKLNYIDLSRSNDATIAKIATLVPEKTLATYGQILIPVDSSQANIEALAAKYWKPVGPRIDITSCEIVTELDEIKPGKTTKLYYGDSTPWYGDKTNIECVSSNESVATIDKETMTITSTGVEGTVEITARIADTEEVISEPKVLSVSETDNYPNVIKIRLSKRPIDSTTIITVNGVNKKIPDFSYSSRTGIYTYESDVDITKVTFNGNGSNLSEIVKFASNVTDMSNMFKNFYNLTTLDLSNVDTNKATNMSNMFDSCLALTSLDLSNFNTSNVTNMYGMFYNCYKLTSLDLSNFNTSSVTNMTYMFFNCNSLEVLDIRNFDMNKVTATDHMFQDYNKLQELRLDNCSKDTINKIITSYGFPTNTIDGVIRKIYVNPDNVVGLRSPENWIFVDCETGEEIIEQEIPTTEILVYTTNNKNSKPEIRRQDGEYSGFVRKVEDMGDGYYKIIIGIDDISNPPIHYRFTDCYVNAIEKINIDYLTDMNSTFENSGLTYLDASDWNVSNVQDMGYLFSNCSLNELYISGWNTGCVSNMSYMFNNCSSLGTLDLSNFDTRNVNDMSYMFNECNNLYELNLSNFDMTNTYSVDDMFYNCYNLTTLRLDYCSIETIDKIVNSSNFPADNSGTIYCSWNVYNNVTPPGNWTLQGV